MAHEIDIRFELEGFARGLDEFVARVAKATEAALPDAVAVVRDKVKPTHEMTGAMRQSITHESVYRKGAHEWHVVAGPTVPYTRTIELGKRGSHYRKPEPWFLPGVAREKESIQAVFQEAWRREQPGMR